MSAVPEGSVRVRLLPLRGLPPYAEFHLDEAHLASRVQPVERGTYGGTIAYKAAEVAWGLTQATPEEAREIVAGGGWRPDYVRQVDQFWSTDQLSMCVGEYAEVTRSSGARSLWLCAGVGWDLVERQSAAAAARESAAEDEVDVDVEQEAER